MRRLLIILALLLIPVAGQATDGEWRFGNGNEAVDRSYGATGRCIGPIFDFSGTTGRSIDSCRFFILSSTATKNWKAALYVLSTSSGWDLVDSTSVVSVIPRTTNQWIFLPFQLGSITADTLYTLQITSATALGSENVVAIDTNLTYTLLVDQDKGIYTSTQITIDSAWKSNISGTYAGEDSLPAFWIYYDAPTYADSLIMDGDGSYTQWSVTSGNRWEAINAAGAPYIYDASTTPNGDTCDFTVTNTTMDTISYVELFVKYESGPGLCDLPTMKLFLANGGDTLWTDTIPTPASTTFNRFEFFTAPDDGEWTQEDVNGLSFGVISVNIDDAECQLQLTHAYLFVYGTAPASTATGQIIIIGGE